MWAGHGRSITRTDLVAYRTELVVMMWVVVRSRRLVKHGELPTRYLRVATTLKASSYDISQVYYDMPTSIREIPRLLS